MAVDVHITVECGNSYQHELVRPPPAIAFLRDQTFSSWWTPRCEACLDRLSRHDQPTRYEVVYLNVDPSGDVRPATEPDHDQPALD